MHRRRYRILGLLAFVLTVAFLAGWVTLRLTWLADLPPVDELPARMARPATRIYDRHGRLLYEVLDPNAGKLIELPPAVQGQSRYGVAGVPDACVQATLATEDRRFFLHPGVDPLAIARAAWQNLRAGGQIVSGASTLTQQLARTLLMDPEARYDRSLRRKVREAYLALQLEQRYTKAELLRLYLNQTYYGNFAVGLEAAAQNFFAKPAAQLSRAECALLAGLVQNPLDYNPLQHPEAAKARQGTVLRLMAHAGFISAEEAAQIAAEPLRYRSRLFDIQAPHFVMYVQDLLVEQLGVDRVRAGGLEVTTTLDLGLQRQAEAAVRHRLDQLNCRSEDQPGDAAAISPLCRDPGARSRRMDNAAAVVLDAATGDILAMVGSPDYFDASIQGNVNAVLSLRQPGSAIKPLTYAAAMDPAWSRRLGLEPLTPASILPDLPRAFPGLRSGELAALQPGALGESGAYMPANYDLRYHGPVSVREALANSYNIPAVTVLERIGVPTLQRLAAAAGISSFTGEYGLALTLGGGEVSLLELTTAYAIFPRRGQRLETRAILGIEDRGSGIGDLSTRASAPNHRSPISGLQSSSPSVIAPETAYLITDILSDPVARIPAFGEGSVLDLPFPAAAKTGTTTDWRDNWTIGYSSRRLVGVWVGNADNTPMQGVTGIDGAGPIWRDVMLASHPSPPPPFERPARIKELTICAPSGLLPSPDCPRLRRERFIVGTEPTRMDDQFVRIPIDLATGLRAGPDTPRERVVERVYWRLGPEYAAWMAAQGLPQPPPEQPATSALNPAQPRTGTQQAALVLAEPVGNSAYAVHPGVPRARQRLPVRGYARDGAPWASLRVLVDGQVLLRVENAHQIDGWWELERGEHVFRLEGERTENGPTFVSAEAVIVVE